MPLSNMEEEFNKLKNKFPDLSTFVIFEKCLPHTTKRKLRKDFEKYVDKQDYFPSLKEPILKWLRGRTEN